MKVCLFTIRNIFGCHYGLFGYRETLERMGHQVIECAFPGNAVQDIERIKRSAPSLDELNSCDLILSTYHEYIVSWLFQIYTIESWKALKPSIVARFDESMDRADLGLPGRMPELLKWATHLSFPAAQDAAKFDGSWEPFGADTSIFNPMCCEKLYDVAFIGTMYPTRQTYLQKLAPHAGGVTFHVGSVAVQDLSGVRERESTLLLAENYHQIKIFFCLPPVSHLIIEKVFDLMACDTFVMYPRLYGPAEKNLSLFEHEKHLVYYDVGYFANNAKQIKFFLEANEEREKIARAGGELVRSKFTLEHLLDGMIRSVWNDGNAAVPACQEVSHG